MARISKELDRVADELVKLQVRAPIVRHLTGAPQAVVSQYYQKHHGCTSKSGLMPSNPLWFVQGGKERQHGALILLLYMAAFEGTVRHHQALAGRVNINALSPTAGLTGEELKKIKAIAFARALRKYQQDICQGDPYVSSERAYTLIQIFADSNSFMRTSRAPRSADQIKLHKCSRCNSPVLVEAHYNDFTCEDCPPLDKKVRR